MATLKAPQWMIGSCYQAVAELIGDGPNALFKVLKGTLMAGPDNQ